MLGFPIVVLHLSDLHFGWSGTRQECDNRVLALRGLSTLLQALTVEWRPQVVTITGDIGWRGESTDYESAGKWVREIMTSFGVSPSHIFPCPGNHDIQRSLADRVPRAEKAVEADKVLSINDGPQGIASHFEQPFLEYSQFCRDLGIPPYSLGDTDSYCTGVRDAGPLTFICCNTAWFSRDDEDKGKLWLGLPHLKHLAAREAILTQPSLDSGGHVFIALAHHPPEWLADAETSASGQRPNTRDFLATRCHLLLTGHTHGELRCSDTLARSAHLIRGGAAYAGAEHFNSFRIFRITRDAVQYRAFQFQPASVDNVWSEHDVEPSLPLRSATISSRRPGAGETSGSLGQLRQKSRIAAEQLKERKLRTLKPHGTLPVTTQLQVSRVNIGLDTRKDSQGQWDRSIEVPLQPQDALSCNQRCFLRGDLGSGKSTVAANYVTWALEDDAQCLAFLVEARKIGCEITGQLVLVEQIELAWRNQIDPTGPGLDLRSLLQAIPIVVVVDGLDELTSGAAAKLLGALSSLPTHWATLRVIVAGRSLELRGLDYSKWSIYEVQSLSSSEQRSIWIQEALAESRSKDDAVEIANKMQQRLNASPSLSALARTPLGTRLLYHELPGATDDVTLSDLLVEVLRQRLGKWAELDQKEAAFKIFEATFPTIDDRAELFSELSLAALLGSHNERNDSLSLHSAREVLRTRAEEFGSGVGVTPKLISEAIAFLERSGLATVDSDTIEFPNRPLHECLSAWGLSLKWARGEDLEVPPTLWRTVGLTAAVARRTGTLSSIERPLQHYLHKLLAAPHSVGQAACIVAESQTEQTARIFLEDVQHYGWHELWVSRDSLTEEVIDIAAALTLAGDDGFHWLFDEYFDPRFPFEHRGSAITEGILREWIVRNRNRRLPEAITSKLAALLKPHQDGDGEPLLSTIPLLAIVARDALSAEEQAGYAARLLRFGDTLEADCVNILLELHARTPTTVLAALYTECHRKYENAGICASLWLRLASTRPDVVIVRALLSAPEHRLAPDLMDQPIATCRERLGDRSWFRCLRWFLADGDQVVATHAVMLLLSSGTAASPALKNALRRCLGEETSGVEHAYGSIIDQEGPTAIRQLAESIIVADPQHFCPAGAWRLLLPRIPQLEEDGPGILVQCISSIGHVLTRHQEVREHLRRLLKRGAYRDALKGVLTSIDPALRHGAACVLITCFPDSEDDALHEAVRAAGHKAAGYHVALEWESFLIELPFGVHCIRRVENEAPRYRGRARTLALGILHKHGRLAETSELISNALGDIGLGFRQTATFQNLVSASEAHETLSSLLQQGDHWQASAAARHLRKSHASRIDESTSALCDVVLGQGTHDTTVREAILRKCSASSGYRARMLSAARSWETRSGERAFALHVAEASSDLDMWERILGEFLRAKPMHFDADEEGHWFIQLAKRDSDIAVAIGAAAKNLFTSKLVSVEGGTALLWVGILANEFGGLPLDALAQVPNGSLLSRSAALPAVLARCKGMQIHFTPVDPGVPSIRVIRPIPFDRQSVTSGLSQNLRPGEPSNVDQILSNWACSDWQLTAEEYIGLEHRETLGPISRVVIDWFDDVDSAPEAIVAAMETRSLDQVGAEQLGRLIRSAVFPCAFSGEQMRIEIVALLRLRVKHDTYPNPLQLSALFSLATEEARGLLPDLAGRLLKFPDALTWVLVPHVVDWAIECADSDEWDSLDDVVSVWLEGLRSRQPVADVASEALVYLLFPLISWLLSGSTNALSQDVFSRGLLWLVEVPKRRGETQEILSILAPLVERVPPELLRQSVAEAELRAPNSIGVLRRIMGFSNE